MTLGLSCRSLDRDEDEEGKTALTSEVMKVFGPSLVAMDSSQAAASLSESFLDWQLGKYKLKVKEITGEDN